MAFESSYTQKKKKKSGFEASSKMSVDTAYVKRKRDEAEKKLSSFTQRYQDYFNTADSYLSRKNWDMAAPSYEDADRFKAEAESLLYELNDNRRFLANGDYAPFLDKISTTDYTKLAEAIKGEADFRKQIGSAENYKKLLAEAERRKEYEGYTYSQLKDKADILKSTGNKEKADWVSSFAKTVMTGEDYDAEIKAIDNEIAELESALDQYKDAKITMRTGDYTQQWFREWGAKYGSKKEIRARISQLEKERKDLEGGKTYTQMLSEANADKDYDSFVEKGKIKGAPYQDLNAPTASKISGLRSGTDDRYVSVRDNEGAIDDIEHIAAENMNEEEYNLYLYFLGKYGEDKANEFLDSMSSSLYLRDEQKYNQKLTAFAKENPFIASALSVPASLFSGVEYIKDLPQYVTEDTAPRNQTSSLVSTIRGAVSEDVHINIGKWDAGSFVYNTVMSGADSLAAGLTGYAGGVILGLSAAASATNEAVERGLSKEDAFFSGVTAGVFEGLFESVSIGNLKSFKTLPEKTLKGYAKNIAKSMLVNASEETLTEIANITYDIIYNGDLSNYEIAVQMYIDKGFSEEEARSKAATDLVVQVAEAGASGALMGFGFGAAGSVSNAASHAIESTREKTDEGRKLLSGYGSASEYAEKVMTGLGLERNGNEKLFRDAERLAKAQRNHKGEYRGRDARLANRVFEGAATALDNSGNVGRLYDSITDRQQKKALNNDKEGFRKALRKAIKDKGIENAKEAERSIFKAVYVGSITEADSKVIEESGGREILSELLNSEAFKAEDSQTTTVALDAYMGKLFPAEISEEEALQQKKDTTDKLIDLAMGQAHFDTDYSDESDRIDEEKTELGEIVRFEETKNEEGATVSTPVIKVDDREVSASEIDLKADSIYSNVEGMDISLANEMISAYKAYGGNVSAESFAADWKMAYQMGLENRGAEHSDFKSYGFKISPEAAEAARALGQDEFSGTTQRRKTDIKKDQKKKPRREGTLVTGEVHNKKLISEAIERISRVLNIAGYNVRLFEDYGKHADRGSYSWETNTINLNVAVGSGRGAVDLLLGRTLSHELTHSIQRWNPDGYEELKGFIIDKMGDSFESMVYQRMNDFELDRADAIDEVVAYSCEMMLRDSKALTEFAKEHRTLFEKICDIVEEFIKKIRAALPALYDNIGPESQEARFMDLYLTDLQTVFDKALSDALNASEATVDHSLQSNANKKAAEDGGKVQYSKGEKISKRLDYEEWEVQSALYDALDHKDEGHDNLIKIGQIPNYVYNKLGIDGDFYIYRNHAYENIVSAEKAKEDGRYNSRSHYHSLGIERFTDAILSLNNPIMTISTSTGKNNPAVIMILPVKGENGVPLYSVLSFYTNTDINGDFSKKPHVVLSIYEREAIDNNSNTQRDKSLSEVITEAINDGRVLDLNKEMRDSLSVMAKQARLGNITEASLEDSLTRFRKEIKTFKEKNKIQYSRGDAYAPYAEYNYFENRKTYGESLIDSLERTVQTHEDKVIINDYRRVEGEVSIKRQELADLNRQINDTIYTPMDQKEAARIEGLENDKKALNREIRKLSREIKKVKDNITVTEAIIKDKDATAGAKADAIGRITAERQSLSRLERQLSAKKTNLKETEKSLKEARSSRTNKLKEIRTRANELRREISEADKTLLELRSTKRFKTLLARERAQAVKDTRALMFRRQAESRTRQEDYHIRQRIWNEMQKLEKLLALPTVAKHVPSNMISTVATLSQAVPGRDVDYDAKIAKMTEIMRASTGDAQIAAEEKIAEYTRKKEYAERVSKALSDVISSLPEDSPVFDEGVLADVQSLSRELEGKSLDELTTDELEKLLHVIEEVKGAIKNSDRVFGEKQSLSTLSAEGVGQVKSAHKSIKRGPKRQKLYDMIASIGYNILKPYELFEITGSEVLCERFRKLQAREGVYYRNIDEASAFYKQVADESGITKRQLKEKFSYTTTEGKTVALSIDEMMSIYLMKSRPQAMLHLTDPSGGFRFAGGYTIEPKAAKEANEKLKNAKTAEEKQEILKTTKYTYSNTSDPIRLSEIDVNAISSMLTKDQKAFADSIQKFMAQTLGAKGNEVSTALYDVKKFTDPDYFPIHTDAGYRLLSIEKSAGEIQLKNLGFTKDLKYKANEPLVLESMSEVFARHANEMSLYHAFAVELENMKRVLNYSTDEDPGGGMKAALGPKMTKEIVDFIKEVNGGVKYEREGISEKLISLSKSKSVGFSLSVMIQQPSAIIRAFSMIDPKYFTGLPGMKKADIQRDGKIWDEMKRYTSTAGIKELGGVDINTSRGITDKLTDTGLKGKPIGESIYEGIQNAAFFLPEVMDKASWSLLWTACKREAAQTYSGKKILEKAGERFDEIVNRTQVYDSVFSRPKWMRSKNTLSKMATAFMAEPLTTANMVIQAARDLTSGDPTRKKAGMRAFASVIASTLVNNLLVSVIYAARDDDEDESYLEKYIESFIQKSVSDIFLHNYIPIFKDIASLISGYDVDRMDMALLSDLIDAAEKVVNCWLDEESTVTDHRDAWISFGGSILDFAGIPASNLLRDVRSVGTFINTLQTKVTAQGVRESIKDGFFDNSNSTVKKLLKPSDADADKLYRALKAKDYERYNQIAERLQGEGKTRTQIQSLISKGIKQNDERVTAAAEAIISGDLRKRDKILFEIMNDGFAKDIVNTAIESKVSELTPDDPPEDDEFGIPDPAASEEFYSIYNADHIFANLEAGDTYEAQIAIDDIFANKYAKALSELKDDEDEDDAEKSAYQSLRSMISADYRPLYKAGDSAERERIMDMLLDIHVNGEQLYKKSTIEGWEKE